MPNMKQKKGSLTAASVKQLDKHDMLGLFLDFPLQCGAAVDIAKRATLNVSRKDFSRICFAGLGGSAIGADLVRSYAYGTSKLPINVYREYDLPANVDSSTLVFISSYSGNTEETLSAYAEARERNATIIAISSGGEIQERAGKDNVPFIGIPKGLPPRCALGYLSIIPLCVLSRLSLLPDADAGVRSMIATLEGLRDHNLKPAVPERDNIAKHIASRLYNKLAVIYTGSIHFDAVATRWRGQLNENAKALASSHVFPEMNHNEIVGWQHPKKLFKDAVVLMLRDADMHKRVALRMDISREIIRKEGTEVIEVWSRGEGLLSRIYSLVYIGDFVSYYLALLYGIDPTPVERVTFLKNELAKVPIA